MAKKRTFKGQKAQKPEKATIPFEGLIKQLERETLVLVNIYKAKGFVKACFEQKIKVGVGDVYNGGVIIYKDK